MFLACLFDFDRLLEGVLDLPVAASCAPNRDVVCVEAVAYAGIVFSCEGNSLIATLKRKGDRTDPWGVPVPPSAEQTPTASSPSANWGCVSVSANSCVLLSPGTRV